VVTAEAPIIGGWTGRFTTNLHYTSDYDFTPGAGGPLQTDKQPSSFLMDLSADVEPANGRLQIGFYINNVTNKQYYTNRGIGTLGIDALPAPPRTVGVRLTAKF
jgi:outer membrane receptor protein involved in Fe transport